MKSFIKKASTALLVVYLIIAGITGIYFEHQYAKDSSTVEWLFFGGTLPGLQGLVWPYYLLRRGDKNSSSRSAFQEELRHFEASINLCKEANEILYRNASEHSIGNIEQDDMDQAIVLLSRSIAEASQVSDRTLAKFDVEMPDRYRTIFVRGMSLFVAGASPGGDRKQVTEGGILLIQFREYYATVYKQLQEK